MWSTREIAELAGTTVRAVRHYHQVGLLEEPERRANGYKQYGVVHLVRLLRIKRLSGLGFSLVQIGAMGDENPEEAVRTLDADLAQLIEQLQQRRAGLRALLTAPAAPPVPVPEQADKLRIRRLQRVLGASGGGPR